MKKNASKLFKTFVAVSMSAVMLAGGSLSAAASVPDDNVIMPRGSESYTVTLKRGTTLTIDQGVEKSISDVAATVNMEKGIPVDDLVTTFVKNRDGDIVSLESAKFRGTTSITVGKMPYRSGTGVAGKRYRLSFSLSQSSKDYELKNVKCSFIP